MTLILTFSLREKELGLSKPESVGRNSLSLRERARVRVASEAVNLLKA
jgi:hypothetical protein